MNEKYWRSAYSKNQANLLGITIVVNILLLVLIPIDFLRQIHKRPMRYRISADNFFLHWHLQNFGK